MRVDSITYDAVGGRYGDRHLSITVAIVDDLDNTVAGASVSIELENTTINSSWSNTGTTGSDGTVTFELNNAPSGCYVTTVTNVSAVDLTWDWITPDNEFCK